MILPGSSTNFDASAASISSGAGFPARTADPSDINHDAEVQYRTGRAAWQLGKSEEAGAHFRRAIALAPNHVSAFCALADWCLNTGNLQGALQYSERAIFLAPDGVESRTCRASAVALSGDYSKALAIIQPLLNKLHCPPSVAVLYAKFARPLKLTDQAINLIHRLLNSQACSKQDRADLHFAAAELLDRQGCYDQAFEHATSAHNASRRPYNPAQIRQLTDHRIAYYTPQKLHGLPRATHGSRRPVFIVGMPRSGTTLVEQILCSHPEVYGAGEVAHLGQIVRAAAESDSQGGFNYPTCLDSLSLRSCNELAAQYLASLTRLNSTARYVTDKMLPNFLYLGTITTLFPDCHVIHCVRDPLDTCLSCYMTQFQFGHEFAQDLSTLGHYYAQYRRLMSHWRDRLKFPMIEVSYENMVANQESETRRLLEHLDLQWTPRCMEFHRNPRHVPTASVEQVRQPMYGSSVGRWRSYAQHLKPIVEILERSTHDPHLKAAS